MARSLTDCMFNRQRHSQTAQTGAKAEADAEQYLKQHKLKSVANNYRCRYGEIDLVMKNDNTLVFVEVKFRRSHSHGYAEEMVTAAKQQKIIAAAEHFLSNHSQYQQYNCRFDVVAVAYDNSQQHINWIKDAFVAY